MNVPSRKLLALSWLFAVAVLALAVACGGDDDGNAGTGQLTDPHNVPTATAWQQPPEVILLDPNNIQPLPPSAPNSGGGEPTPTPLAGEPGECGDTYTVVSGDTTFGIAEKCGVDPQAIMDANPDVDPRNLSIGQVLVMPAASSEEPTETPA